MNRECGRTIIIILFVALESRLNEKRRYELNPFVVVVVVFDCFVG